MFTGVGLATPSETILIGIPIFEIAVLDCAISVKGQVEIGTTFLLKL